MKLLIFSNEQVAAAAIDAIKCIAGFPEGMVRPYPKIQ